MLQENNKNYKRNDFLIRILKIVSDENLFTSNGDFWLRQRRLMQPAFHRQRIAGFGQIMVEQAQRAMERWERLKLIVIKGADEGKQFELASPFVSIGRDAINSIRLNDTEVSRRHAELFLNPVVEVLQL